MAGRQLPPGARLEVVLRSLPGRAVAGVALAGGVVWVVLDPGKPHAYWHGRVLVNTADIPAPARELFLALLDGLANDDGQ